MTVREFGNAFLDLPMWEAILIVGLAVLALAFVNGFVSKLIEDADL